jgi:Ser/Thr protein kinase RdoA (MazF antagonist)
VILFSRTLDFAFELPVSYNWSMKKTEPYIEKSARAFGIDPSTLESLGEGNTRADVLIGKSGSGPKVLKIQPVFIVRIFGGTESTLEGLVYQEGLAEKLTGDVAFAGPLRSINGNLGEEIETDDGIRVAMLSNVAKGKEVRRRSDGYQIPISNPEIGGLLYERVGRALGIMHRYSSEYPVWWPAHAADLPHTPFTGRKDRDGATAAPAPVNVGQHYIETAVAEEPELTDHWESILSARKTWVAGRNEFGYLHYDYGLTNMLYDLEQLTIIDHMALFGWFFDDVACPFVGLKGNGIPDQRIQTYWGRFVSGYSREFTLKAEWIPRLRITLDSRRLLYYAMNMAYKKSGVDSADFPMLEKWREDMIAERPFVDIDFSLP